MFTHDSIYDEETATLRVSGYLKGSSPLSANQLIHITGVGTYQMTAIVNAEDPCPSKSMHKKSQIAAPGTPIAVAKPELQEPLQSKAAFDPNAAEQSYISDSELQEADEALKHAKEGGDAEETTHHEAWIRAAGIEMEDGDGGIILNNSEATSRSSSDAHHHGGDDIEVSATDAMFNKMELLSLRQRQAEDDVIFPDEIDTPQDVPARQRFARYRGLKSFRSSPWDPKESLPMRYAHIFQLHDFAHSQKLAFERVDEAEKGVRSFGYGLSSATAGAAAMDVDGESSSSSSPFSDWVPSGKYVTIIVSGFDKGTTIGKHLVVSSLLKHENKESVMHFLIQRSTLLDDNVVIRSKDVMDIQCGFRRFTSKPIFSEHNIKCDKHKFERFLQPGRFLVVSAYMPITFGPGISACVFSNGSLVASGTTMGANPDRIILKRLSFQDIL